MKLPSFRSVLCALTLLGLCIGTQARAADPIAQTLQQSFVWRGATETSAAYTVFRKTFSAADVSAAKLHIFADARYVLWINGRYVSRGPCRFDPDGPEYDTHDVTSYLSSGCNTLAVMVMSFPTAISTNSGKMIRHAPGLTALLTTGTGASAVSVGTDATWKWKTGLRYKAPGIGWGIINDSVDARLDDGDWTQAAYVDTAWTAAATIAGTQWGTLRARSTPLLMEQDVAAQGGTFPLVLSNSNAFYFTLPRMVQGYLEIDAESAAAGSSIKIEVGEKGSATTISSTYGSAFNFTANAGRTKCFNTDSMGFRYVKVTSTSGTMTLHGLRVVDRRYPYVDAGSFNSSDAWLNDLWGRAVHTIRMCSDDGYMDCTLRERAEWLGDAAVVEYPASRVALAGPAVTGQPLRSDSGLMKNLIRHVAQSANQFNDGRLKAHAPSDRNDIHGYIEDYSCLWVQTVRQVYENTGDLDLVNEVWAPLAAQMQWFLDRRSAARGLVYAREFVIFDNPLRYVPCEGATLNAFVYRALLDAAILGDAIGKTTEAAGYRAAAATLQTNFNTYLWDATNGTYIGGLDVNGNVVSKNNSGTAFSPTSTAHAAMITLDRGIVPSNRVASVRQYFLGKYASAVTYPYTAFWALENLYDMDDPVRDAEALSYIRTKWTTMMNVTDTGTLTESFGGGEPCHNFGASAAYFLSAYVLGVRMDGPASAGKIIIEPRLGNLTSAQGNVVTELGVVPIAWSVSGGSFNLDFTVPTGATATVRVPQIIVGTFPSVVLDGVPVNNPATSGRYVVLSVPPGAHQLRAANNLTWKGDGAANVWDAGTTANWLNDQSAPSTFLASSRVTFDDSGSTPVSLSGILSPGSVTVNANKNYTFSGSGSIGGVTGLVKSGSGTLTLNTANSYTGDTTFNEGVIMIGNATSLGTGGSLVFNGGTLAVAGSLSLSKTLVTAGVASVSINTQGYTLAQNGDIAAGIGATGGLVKSGSGTLTLNGVQSYSGATTIQSGTLKLGARFQPPSIAGLIYRLDASNAGSLSLSGSNIGAWTDSAGSATSFTQVTTAKQPTYVANALNGKPIVRFSGAQQLLLSNSTAPREIIALVNVKGGVDGNIGGFLGINGADTGLRLNSSAGSWAADGATTTVNGVATTTYTSNQPHVVQRYGTTWGTWAATGFGQYFAGGASRFFNGDVAEVLVYGNALTTTDRANLLAYLNAKWLGTGSYASQATTLPAATAASLAGAGATLDLSGANQTIGSLSGVQSSLVLNNASLTVGSNDASTTFSGIISGTGSFTKLGNGTTTLTGSNTFTGATTVSAGRLALAGSLNCAITVSSGTFAPLGTPVTTGNVAIGPGGTFQVQLNGPIPGTQYDQMNVGGTVTLSGALNIIAAPGLTAGTSFTILNKTSAGAISGTFAGKPEGSVFAAGGYSWIISYIGGTGNDVVLTIASAQQAWRFTYFGITTGTGNAADSADPNKDGENNLLEFATGQNPNEATTRPGMLVRNDSNFGFTCTRSKAALLDGFKFTVEYSDTLAAESWTAITDPGTVIFDDGTLQEVKALVPAGSGSQRFVRLEIARP